MADRAEGWLEQPVTRLGRRADRGRWTPLVWAGGLALVAGFAVAGQRLAVAPVAVAQPAREVAVANAAPPPTGAAALQLAPTPPPWITSRRWSEDAVIRLLPGRGPDRLDRRLGRVLGGFAAPMAR